MPKTLDWERLLVDGYEPLRKAQRIFRRLPSDPRCKLCQNPFGARLQACAAPGQLVLASDLYSLVVGDLPGARFETIIVRGRDGPVHVAVLSVSTD